MKKMIPALCFVLAVAGSAFADGAINSVRNDKGEFVEPVK